MSEEVALTGRKSRRGGPRHLQKETPSQGKRRAGQRGQGQTGPKPDLPAHWIKTLEVPYLV